MQALVAWLVERFDAGERLPRHETHWITVNAWRTHRYGVRGWLVDLNSGRRLPTREQLGELIELLQPYAVRFDGTECLHEAR